MYYFENYFNILHIIATTGLQPYIQSKC